MKNKLHFLPTTKLEMDQLGIKQLDVILVTADAYVDHPSFGTALIGRFIESLGFTVGIIPQPDWKSDKDFTALGQAKYFFGVTAGNLDSMVSLYTSQRKIRSDDPYSEAGISGNRPYLPSIKYTQKLKQLYKDVPVVLGGIEASLRRVSHYDYYQNKLRASILLDSKADLLVYGSGEAPVKELVKALKEGQSFKDLRNIPGTVIPIGQKEKDHLGDCLNLPSHEEVLKDKDAFNQMTKILVKNINPYVAKAMYQDNGSRGIFINPPQFPMTSEELDYTYGLNYTRKEHPRYNNGVPALKVVEHSITSHRGCHAGCSFCAIYFHQGKTVQSRSPESIKQEALILAKMNKKPVVITDIGGPTANMFAQYCVDKETEKKCKRLSCIFPNICKNLNYSSKDYLKMLEEIRNLPEVKKVYINSGIRYDTASKDPDFIRELVKHYTQGQLSVAPEHASAEILKLMHKPNIESYEAFMEKFYNECKRLKKDYYLIPYLIVGHPGTNQRTEKELEKFIKKNNIKVQQIQEFYPTPMTLSTAQYYTGKNPLNSEEVTVNKKPGQIKKQKGKLINTNLH